MFDRQVSSAGHFDDYIHRLMNEVAFGRGESQESILQRALQGIRSIEPFIAAGVISGDAGGLHWIEMRAEEAEEEILRRVLSRDSARLQEVIRNGNPVQVRAGEAEDDRNGESSYFVGTPAGQVSGDWLVIGYLCQRKLEDEELTRLVSLSRVIGLSVENARLSRLHEETDMHGSVAQLIGLIAHELRTPLTGMRGNIQLALMSSRKGQHDRVPNRLESAIAAVDNMASLVQKLLDVSRLERGNYPFQTAESDLRQTITAAIEDVLSRQEAEPSKITLADGLPVEHVHDSQALQRALAYLLETVRRYVRGGSGIMVTVDGQGSDPHIDISYDGNKFSETDQIALSSPLYEGLDRGDYDAGHELALELAFLRGIVQHHHGRIELLNAGSQPPLQQITVWLPSTAQ